MFVPDSRLPNTTEARANLPADSNTVPMLTATLQTGSSAAADGRASHQFPRSVPAYPHTLAAAFVTFPHLIVCPHECQVKDSVHQYTVSKHSGFAGP